MQQAFDQLLACHQGHELRSPHAQQQAGNEEEAVVKQVVKQVRARVKPQHHLALAVVQGVQLPPPAQVVLHALDGVVDQLKQQQVNGKAHPSQGGDAGPERVYRSRLHARQPQVAQCQVNANFVRHQAQVVRLLASVQGPLRGM